MSRLASVVLLCIAMFAALWSVRDFDPRSQPSDEILAYEVGTDSSVSVSVPGGVERVLITTWLTVPIGASDQEHLYEIATQLFGFDGKPLGRRNFATRTRVSDLPDGATVPAARLADASAWVCEPRSFELAVPELAGRAGVLRVSLSERREAGSVLLRLTHAVERGEIERRLVERALSAHEIERIMARRSSLGFFDIPLEQRTRALATWERRLTAQGRAGRDYFTRRLLLGGPDQIVDREPWRDEGQLTSPERRLALNVEGEATLRVEAAPETVVLLRDGEEDQPSSHSVPRSGYVDLSLPEGPLRTLEVYAAQPALLVLSSPRSERWPWVTAREPKVVAERYRVTPDFRHQTYYRLERSTPIVLEMAEGQASVGLSVRAFIEEGKRRRIDVAASWRDEEGEPVSSARHSAVLSRSAFEVVGEQAVTDASVARLHVPPRAVRLELFGSDETLVSPFVSEPFVVQPKALPPYDTEPPDTLAWRNEPWEVAPVAGIAPNNVDALQRADRVQRVRRQVRLEPLEGVGAPITERVLEPAGIVTKRSLFRPQSYYPGLPFPANAWVWLDAGPGSRRLVVPEHGALSFLFLADIEALGGRWSLRADGREVLNEPVVVTDGRGMVELLPGATDLSFSGLGTRGVLLMQAAPTEAATVVKRQGVYELLPGGRLTFPFTRAQGELLSIAMFVVGPPARMPSLRLRHRIDRGQLATHQGFFLRTTEPTGVHTLEQVPASRGFVWRGDPKARVAPNADALHRVIVRLGDDLSVGRHEFEIALHGARGAPLWVRAVLVGSILDDEGDGRP